MIGTHEPTVDKNGNPLTMCVTESYVGEIAMLRNAAHGNALEANHYRTKYYKLLAKRNESYIQSLNTGWKHERSSNRRT
jgi:hypothetical protein